MRSLFSKKQKCQVSEQNLSLHAKRLMRGCITAFLAIAVACGMAGCKTTDFFTEVLISPDASTIDADNPDKTIVNSPSASKESDALSALEWSDNSTTTQDEENLVTYSKKPNSTLNTQHSYYDPKPLFPGIKSSDGVRLVFNAKADLDHEVDNVQGDGNDAMQSVSSSNSGKQTTVQSVNQGDSNSKVVTGGDNGSGAASGGTDQAQEEQGKGESDTKSGEGDGGDNGGGDGSGDTEGKGDSTDPSDNKGDTTDKHGGFGGSLTVYDPNNAKAEIPQADSIVAIGKRVAVMVQAIGGEGSVCAMSKDAYNGKDTGTTKSFKDVFGDECSKNVVAWDNDDSSIKKIKISKITKNLKGKTLILYDQDLVDGDDDPNKTFFTEKQLEALDKAGVIGFAPLSFDTEYGIVDAAYYVGKALKSSDNLKNGWSSEDMATSYVDAVNSIVKGTIATNTGKGNWVYGKGSANKKNTDYKGSSLSKNGTETYIHSIIVTDAQRGLDYTGEKGKVDASDIILFAGYGQYKYSPLGFWMQAAGVADSLSVQNSVGTSSDGAVSPKFLTLLWGTSASDTISKKNIKGSSGAYVNWHGSVSDMSAGGLNNTDGGKQYGGGLGSQNMPYLIVNGSQDGKLSAKAVKKALVKSINNASEYTPYSAFEYSEEVSKAIAPYNSTVVSSIGDTNSRQSVNPFKDKLDADDVVRINPAGLLEGWTKGNFESVLETAWLACVYSKSPSGCNYTPEYDWSKFEAKIGDETIKGSDNNGDAATTLQQLVEKFYKKFYRYDVDYSSIVTDEGLND